MDDLAPWDAPPESPAAETGVWIAGLRVPSRRGLSARG
jgi:hypothetical protein